MSRREEKRVQTRERLIDAAFGLFSTKGYAATTMEEIAGAADVSRRTAFRYFDAKESLVFPYRDDRLALFQAELERACLDPQHASRYHAVRSACLVMAGQYMEDRARVLMQERIVRASRELEGLGRISGDEFEGLVTAALQPDARSEDSAQLEAAAVVAIIRVTIRQWIDDDAKGDLVELGRAAFDFLETAAFGRE